MLESGFEPRHFSEFRVRSGDVSSQTLCPLTDPWPTCHFLHSWVLGWPGIRASPRLLGLCQTPGGLCSLPVFVPLKDRAYGQQESNPEGIRAPPPGPLNVSLWPWLSSKVEFQFSSQEVLGGFQRERWSVIGLLWINRRRWCEWREVLVCARCRVYFTEGKDVTFVSQESWAHMESDLGGLKVLVLPGGIHSFIIHSFTQQIFFELSLSTRFCVQVW